MDAGGVVAADPGAEGAGVATVAGDGEAVGFALFVSGSALQAANVNEIASTKNSFFIMINLLLRLLRTSADNCRSNVCRAVTGVTTRVEIHWRMVINDKTLRDSEIIFIDRVLTARLWHELSGRLYSVVNYK